MFVAAVTIAVVAAVIPVAVVAALFFKAPPFVAVARAIGRAVTGTIGWDISDGCVTRGVTRCIAGLIKAHIGARATRTVIRSLLCHDPAVRRMAGRLTCCHADGGS
jgi:hypothetical protein